MALYEHIFLARQDVTAQQVEALTEQLKTKIAALGGAVTKVEPWGLKSLAYRIKKNRKAHFTLLNISAPSAAVVELERTLGLNEDVIRYLTMRVDEHEAGPSAMLRKREDADRDDRGPRGPAATVPIVATAIAAIVATVPRAARAKTSTLEQSDGHRAPPPLLPPPQVLPVLRRQRAEDRLQGHAPAVALHLRARQDRAFAHHRGQRQQAARTRPGDQARPLPRAAALRHSLTDARSA